ncbi:MAG: hypothetical protein AAF351_10010 [Pseudomonadota bacterium]
MKRFGQFSLVALLLAVQPLASADDRAVYESHADVALGRVFLSPADRAYLDANRHLKPSTDSTVATTVADAPTTEQRPAGGYIKGPNGRSRVWQDSDFVTTAADTEALAIPGRVNIVRHVEADDADDED